MLTHYFLKYFLRNQLSLTSLELREKEIIRTEQPTTNEERQTVKDLKKDGHT
jgi:hypothetical protein